MKILHVIATLSPRSGGPSRGLNELTRYQALAGLDVTVFSTNKDNPEGVIDVPVNVPVLKNGVWFYYFSVQFSPLLVSLPMAFELVRSLKNFDLVHIHGLYRFPTTLAAYLSRKYRIPYVIQPHGSLAPFLYKRSSRNILAKRIYERMFDLPNLNAASAIHFTTPEEKVKTAFLNLKPPGIIVSNGIDWTRFESLPSKGNMRRKLGLGDAPMILFLGRINFKKGFDLLVEAFAKVAAHRNDAVLVIAGPDNEGYAKVVREHIERRELATNVHWPGMLHGREVLEAYVDADVFVLPSYSENFGIAVAEAMACGLPVVISDQVDIWPEVSGAGSGYVVRLDSREIADAILAIIDDKALRMRMGAAGRNFARSRYAYHRIVQELDKVYEEIINSESTDTR